MRISTLVDGDGSLAGALTAEPGLGYSGIAGDRLPGGIEEYGSDQRSTSWWSLHVSERKILLLLLDLFSLAVSVLAARDVTHLLNPYQANPRLPHSNVLWLTVMLVAYLPLACACDLYVLRVASSTRRTALSLSKVWLGLWLVGLLAYFLAPPNVLSRRVMTLSLLMVYPLLMVWRSAYVQLLGAPHFRIRALILGAGWAGSEVLKAIQENAWTGYKAMAFVDDDEMKHGSEVRGLAVLGSSEQLTSLVDRLGISEIILAVTNGIQENTFSALMSCSEVGVRVTPMPLIYEQLTGRVAVQHIGRHWYFALPSEFPANRGVYDGIKRVSEIFASILGLCLMVVLFPLIAAALYLDSPGPILYRQQRVGKNLRPFELVKFRSMIPNAEGDGRAVWTAEDDPRITRVGKWLRRTRLDELPQLWNVLKGEMSIVGPRPERFEFTQELEKEIPFYHARHLIKPGLTGWAQVQYPYGNSVDDALHKLQYELYYLRNQSLWLDLIIMLKTIGVVASCKGT